QTLGLHAVVGLLRNFSRQISPADTHVFDLEPERRRIRAKLIANLAHHRGTFLRERSLEPAQAVDSAQSRVEPGAQPLLGKLDLPRHRRTKTPRIGDPVGDKSVDLVELAARDLDANIVEIEAQQA